MITNDTFVDDLITQINTELPGFYEQLKQISSKCFNADEQKYYARPEAYALPFEDRIWYINHDMLKESDVIRIIIEGIKSQYEQVLSQIYMKMPHGIKYTAASDFSNAFVMAFNSLACDDKVLINFGVDLNQFQVLIKGLEKDENEKWTYRGLPVYHFSLYNCSHFFDNSLIIADRASMPFCDFNKQYFFYYSTQNEQVKSDQLVSLEVLWSYLYNLNMPRILEKHIIVNSLIPIMYSIEKANMIQLIINKYDL